LAADPENIAAAVSEVTERATTLIREEIELAKAEITEKVTRLIKGVVVGLAAGIFVVTALMFILHGFAWLAAFELFNYSKVFWGFFIVAGVLLLIGAVAGYLAAKAVRSSSPPTPAMAIDEARKIKDTITARELKP